MKEEIAELLDISRYAGASVDFVQGGGGNTSIKSDDGELYIKASGYRLLDMNEEHGFLALDLNKLLKILNDDSYEALSYSLQQERSASEMLRASVSPSTLRPSLETGFHAILDRVVIHTHPIFLNIGTCLENGRDLLTALIEREVGPVLWVEYKPPGHPLATFIDSKLRKFKTLHGTPAQIVLLENHGLICSGETIKETKALHSRVTELCRDYFCPEEIPQSVEVDDEINDIAKTLLFLLQSRGVRGFICRPFKGAAPYSLSGRKFSNLLQAGPLVPDDVVYWRGAPYMIAHNTSQHLEKVINQIIADGVSQGAVVVDDHGIIVFGKGDNAVAAVEESLVAHILIRLSATKHGNLKSLAPDEIAFLMGMEGEKYRQMVSEGGR